jgi:hypothetical protein
MAISLHFNDALDEQLSRGLVLAGAKFVIVPAVLKFSQSFIKQRKKE